MSRVSRAFFALVAFILGGSLPAGALTIADHRINIRIGSTRVTVPYERTAALGSHNHATAYDVQIKDAAGTVLTTRRYTPIDAHCEHGGLCSVTSATTFTRGRTYTWGVRGVYNTGGSDWSTKTIVVSSPTTVVTTAPSGTINDNTPTFTWQSVTGSSGYSLQVFNSTGALQSSSYYWAEDACPCGATPGRTLSDASYYFKVRAQNRLGSGPWSTSRWFTVHAHSDAASSSAVVESE